MISWKMPSNAIDENIDAVAGIVAVAIKNKLNRDHKDYAELLDCERHFYDAVSVDVKRFLSLKPSALENGFRNILAAIPDYVVFASGSLPKIRAQIASHLLPRYETLWKKHVETKKAGVCECEFCKVSTRAHSIFNWSTFTLKDKNAVPKDSLAGKFVKSVGLSVCPYCSRNHIAPMTEPSNALYRPDLDHFFAKSIYPYFALCLYNLIPSCSACNCRIKGDEDFMCNGYLHPYEDEVPEQLFVLESPDIKTVQRIDPSTASLRLRTDISKKAKKSAEFFRLPLAYESHLAEACHYLDSLRMIPNAILEERASMLNVDVAYLMLILNRHDDAADDTYKHRVLGKLRRDLYSMFKEP